MMEEWRLRDPCAQEEMGSESWEVEPIGGITLAQSPRNLNVTLCVTLWDDHVPVPCLIS